MTGLTVSIVTAFALAGFALASVLSGEEISEGGRFADPDLIIPHDDPVSADLIVTLASLELRSGERIDITILSGPLAPDVPVGEAWSSLAGGPTELAIENGPTLVVRRSDAMVHVPSSRYLVSLEDAVDALALVPEPAYALVSGPAGEQERGGARVPGVEPFLDASSKEVSRDLVLVVIFASVLVTLFSYELIRAEVRDRRRELAVWRALGMRRTEVLVLVMARAAAISAIAAFAGFMLTFVLLKAVRSASGIERLALPTLTATVGIFAAITLAGIIGAVLPAYRASRVQVREAMEAHW